MTTGRFWRDASERAARTFAQALAAILGAGAVGILNVPWVDALSTAGGAALLSVLFSVAGSQAGNPTSASLLADVPDDGYVGRHERR